MYCITLFMLGIGFIILFVSHHSLIRRIEDLEIFKRDILEAEQARRENISD